MTTTKMSEQQRKIVTDAIGKFFSAFIIRGVTNLFPLINITGAILYMLKKGYLSKRINFSNEEGLLVALIDLPYLEVTSTRLFKEWQEKGIQNEALVAKIPENHHMSNALIEDINFLHSINKGEPAYIFEFIDIISQPEYSEFYAEILDMAISMTYSRPTAGQYTQPVEFGELASKLLDVKGKNIFNPFSGLLSFATTLKGYNHFHGVELNSQIWKNSSYRVALADLSDKVDCVNGDVTEWPERKFDVIVSTPPFGTKLSLKGEKRSVRSEMLCLKKFEESTTSHSELISFTLPSVLFDVARGREIRRELTEKNCLDAVIELPANLLRPYTSISPVLVLLKKGREADAPIKMIDASEFYKGDKNHSILDVDAIVACYNEMASDCSVLVSSDDIKNNDYSWSVAKYLPIQEKNLPEGYQIKELGDLVEIFRGERHFEEKKGHLAKISSLATDGADCVRPVESFEVSYDLSHASKITEPVILLSSVRELKPTYCEASKETPFFVHPNLIVCRLAQNWISPVYLCLELSRRFVQLRGNFIPRIAISELRKVKVAFPSIGQERSFEEQNNLYKEAANALILGKAKELGIQKVIDDMKTEYINTVRTRKHDMMPYMRELGSVSRMMRRYVEKVDSEDLKQKMLNLTNLFDAAYGGLSDLVEVFSNEEEFGMSERLNIDDYLLSLARQHGNQPNYTIEYYCDDNAFKEIGFLSHSNRNRKDFSHLNGFEASSYEKPMPLFVEIAHRDLDRVVNNIIENAKQHGFTDVENNDYHIDINLSVEPEKNMFQIDFTNNGTPLPKGLDKVKYGLLGEKAGQTGRTGQGGYIVKSIVEHYHGDYDVFMDGDNTVVRILLPISNNNE